MGARLQGWLRLPPHERWQFLMLLSGLPVVSSMLAMRGYAGTLHLLERASRRAGTRSATTAELQSADRIAQLAALAGMHGPHRARCLPQALLVYWWLRRNGHAPVLRLGGRRQEGRFDAHAWVELDGKALAQAMLAHVPFRKRDPA